MTWKKPLLAIGLFVLTMLAVTISLALGSRGAWYEASRDSAGIAPDPESTPEAVLHIYGADAWGWRGWFAIHTWIAAKRKGESHYTIYDVVGWRGYHGDGVMRIHRDIPDRYWYGARPELLKEHRGVQAESLIDAVEAAAHLYPWKKQYKVFPGPNSNTFTAWIGRQVPELELDLPLSAIGARYVDYVEVFGGTDTAEY
jgi:hypothetical protein